MSSSEDTFPLSGSGVPGRHRKRPAVPGSPELPTRATYKAASAVSAPGIARSGPHLPRHVPGRPGVSRCLSPLLLSRLSSLGSQSTESEICFTDLLSTLEAACNIQEILKLRMFKD